MKVSELLFEARFTDADLVSEKDLRVEEQPDGTFKVSVGVTSGPLINLIRTLAYATPSRIKTKSGGELPRWDKFKANGIIVKVPNRDTLNKMIERAIKTHNKYVKQDVKWAAGADDRKKEASKRSAEDAKQRKAELEAEFGKGTAARVKYRQEGGDDGYQYVVRVDGVKRWDGLTQREAMYYARKEMDEIAKERKIGKYEEKK